MTTTLEPIGAGLFAELRHSEEDGGWYAIIINDRGEDLHTTYVVVDKSAALRAARRWRFKNTAEEQARELRDRRLRGAAPSRPHAMTDTSEIRGRADEITDWLLSPETTDRALSLTGPWDGCRILAEYDDPQGSGPLVPLVELPGESPVSLPSWAGTFDEHVTALLVFALAALAPGPPIRDAMRLAEQIDGDAPDGSAATLERLREVTAYWRSRLAVECAKISEAALLDAARGTLPKSGWAALLPQHRRAALLQAAALLLAGADGEKRAEARVRLYIDEALEEGR